MYPLVAFLQRKCTKPFQIPDTKYTVETGTHIIIPLYSLHHDQKYYPDPQTFDPERFAEGRTLRKGTYLPFGDGPRICIGMSEEYVCNNYHRCANSLNMKKEPFLKNTKYTN